MLLREDSAVSFLGSCALLGCNRRDIRDDQLEFFFTQFGFPTRHRRRASDRGSASSDDGVACRVIENAKAKVGGRGRQEARELAGSIGVGTVADNAVRLEDRVPLLQSGIAPSPCQTGPSGQQPGQGQPCRLASSC